MERESLVLYAERKPISGVKHPGPHQTYRHPRLAVERWTPGWLSPGHIRVEMIYAGVCGTDLHLVQQDARTGYIRTSSPLSVPAEGRIFGHEGIGRVTAAGEDVRHLRAGAIVALESIVVCGHCDRCRRALPNQCRASSLIGMEQDGLFTTAADLPASLAHDVSALIQNDRDLQALACLEPAAVAWVACRKGGVSSGEQVVIFGAGPIGLYCAMLARIAFDAGPVHIVEPIPFRREFAARWADRIFSPDEFFASAPGEIDVAIEASGHAANMDRVLPRMNAGGRIVALGRSGEPLTLTAMDHLITNGISIMGSRGHLGGAFDALLDLYRRGQFQPGEIITRIVNGLDELAALLSAPDHLVERDAKVLVKFPSDAARHVDFPN